MFVCAESLGVITITGDDARTFLQGQATPDFRNLNDDGFVFGGFFHNPNGRQEADTVRAYFTQLRQELGIRLLDRVYPPGGEAAASKWWICFNKRKFMNIA